MTPNTPAADAGQPGLALGIAHDFKNLLFIITAHCQRLMQNLDPADPRRRDAETIALASERAVALTKHLLEASRENAIRATPLDVNDTVRGLDELLRGMVGSGIALTLQLSDHLWTVRANPTQIEQVVMNLVINARDAMPDGGSLVISTENRTTFLGDGPHDCVVFRVQDSGVGMSPEVQARMFDPYFTTKSAGGSGLGLPTVRAIVAANGGQLEVKSAPDQGTAITIVLPRAVFSQPAEAALPIQPAERPARVPARILLVDDEPAVRDLLMHYLQLEGYEAVVASSGAEAMDLAAKSARGVDLLITDLHLPDSLGPDVASRLQERMPDMRVVLMSGSTEATRHFGHRQELPILTKPFSLVDFKRAVQDALAMRRAA